MLGPFKLHQGAPKRTLDCIEAVTLAVFDVDKNPDGSPVDGAALARAQATVQRAGLAAVWYSTYSGPPSHRLVLPLSHPVAPRMWKQFRDAVARKYNLPVVAKESSDASHAFYLPAHRPGAQAVFLSHDGASLQSAAWCRPSIYVPTPHIDDADLFALPADTEPAATDDARRILARAARGYRRSGDLEAADFLEACVAGASLGDSARNPKTARLCWLLIHQLHPWPLERYQQLLAPSVRAMQKQGSSLKDRDVTRMLKSSARKWHEYRARNSNSNTRGIVGSR